METKMGKSIGYVTLNEDGNYAGILTMGLNEKIKILVNGAKNPDTQEPDFLIFGQTMGAIGAAWNKIGKRSENPYVSVKFEDPRILSSALYVNLGKTKDGETDEYAMIWNTA